jgi:exonuclease 1
VQYLVAPYEADAQMAYLTKANLADVVITEDSDLLAYGCPEVLFKLSKTGEVDHIRLADLPLSRSVSFAGFTHDNFIEVR